MIIYVWEASALVITQSNNDLCILLQNLDWVTIYNFERLHHRLTGKWSRWYVKREKERIPLGPK